MFRAAAGYSPEQRRLVHIQGRYGMTTGQMLAAACAVLGGVSAPSGNAGIDVIIRQRLEVDGARAADAYFQATQDPRAAISRGLYPSKRDKKTPFKAYQSWCALRGGPDIEHGEAVCCVLATFLPPSVELGRSLFVHPRSPFLQLVGWSLIK